MKTLKNEVMTVLELLQLPTKDIRQHFIDGGIDSYVCSGMDADKFCNQLNLEKGELTHLFVCIRSNHSEMYFDFNYKFAHLDESITSITNPSCAVVLEGTHAKSFKIKKPQIRGSILNIYDKNIDFFGERSPFKYDVPIVGNSLKKQLEYCENRALKVRPHIEWMLECIESGEFVKAYNMLHDEPYEKYSVHIDERFKTQRYITIRQMIFDKYGVEFDILQLMLFSKYVEDYTNYCLYYGYEEDAFTLDEIYQHIEEMKDRWLLTDEKLANKQKLENAYNVLKAELSEIILDFANVNGIHESYFKFNLGLNKPNDWNIDLKKPFEK